jgi:hypothetical protein
MLIANLKPGVCDAPSRLRGLTSTINIEGRLDMPSTHHCVLAVLGYRLILALTDEWHPNIFKHAKIY